MNVRLATSDDSLGVKTLLHDLITDGFDEKYFDTAFELIIGSPDRALIVVEDSDSIVGSAAINIVQKLASREARIDEVVVGSQYRGRGYGSALMQACDAWAFDHGADVIEFTSRPSREAANALYKKLGYTKRETNVYQRKQQI